MSLNKDKFCIEREGLAFFIHIDIFSVCLNLTEIRYLRDTINESLRILEGLEKWI